MSHTKTYFKETGKNKILLWIFRRVKNLAFWIRSRCDHHDCNKCINHDQYGCLLDWHDGDCSFKEEGN